ncbi:MAG: phosphatase PAP2 family protein [Clostridia bacterium]|nr:phosphatase PAP2 family protein [Clostridia bacterium]
MNAAELGILDSIQEIFSCKFLDAVMPVITRFGDGGIFWIAIAVVLLLFKKTRKIGLTMGIALAMGFIIGNLTLKNIVARTRPYDLNPAFPLLIEKLSDFSFPSGHTLASFEASVSIFLYNKKFGTAAVILAVLIALSRLYLYVHYPTDVLASVIIGTTLAIVSFVIVKKIYAKFEKKSES